MPEFPEYACPYARRLAAASRRFARQVYDPPRPPARSVLAPCRVAPRRAQRPYPPSSAAPPLPAGPV